MSVPLPTSYSAHRPKSELGKPANMQFLICMEGRWRSAIAPEKPPTFVAGCSAGEPNMSQIAYVSYRRVSTDRQGKSGLGLEAQQKAVLDFLKSSQGILLAEFTEIETGRRKDRPQLQAALELCRRSRASLVIAKLDRLARNVAFVSALLESKVTFLAVDMPEADRTFLQMAAVFAEWEARKISERTKAALAAAKARGRQLGWSIPSRTSEQHIASQRGVEANRNRAQQFASNIMPIIQSIQNAGISSCAEIAVALNARGIQTARGGGWHSATVRNVITRCMTTPSSPQQAPPPSRPITLSAQILPA